MDEKQTAKDVLFTIALTYMLLNLGTLVVGLDDYLHGTYKCDYMNGRGTIFPAYIVGCKLGAYLDD